MVLTENKVKSWTVKYGTEQKVQQLLDQYNNFVSRNKIFQEFNKAFVDMQHVVEEYKAEGNIGKLYIPYSLFLPSVFSMFDCIFI